MGKAYVRGPVGQSPRSSKPRESYQVCKAVGVSTSVWTKIRGKITGIFPRRCWPQRWPSPHVWPSPWWVVPVVVYPIAVEAL